MVLCNKCKNLKMQFTLSYKLQIAANVGRKERIGNGFIPHIF